MRCCFPFRREDPLQDAKSAMASSVDEMELICSSLSGASVEDFNFGRTIGTGTYSRVYIVRHIKSSRVLALKCVFKSEVVRTGQINSVATEKDISFNHPHPLIAELYTTFQSNSVLYFAFEYVPCGELRTLLKKTGKLKENAVQFYAGCIVLILDFLHSNNIIYRDLKPENLLLDSDGYLKLCDLGLSKKLGDSTRTYSMVGVPVMMAPEMVRCDGTRRGPGYGVAVDHWALGVILFEMLTGDLPFHAESDFLTFQEITKGAYEVPSYISRSGRTLLRDLLNPDPDLRLRVGSKLRKHDFFKGLNFDQLLGKRVSPPSVPPALPHVQKIGSHFFLNSADQDSLNQLATNYDTFPEDDFDEAISAADDENFKSFGPNFKTEEFKPWRISSNPAAPSAETRRKSTRSDSQQSRVGSPEGVVAAARAGFSSESQEKKENSNNASNNISDDDNDSTTTTATAQTIVEHHEASKKKTRNASSKSTEEDDAQIPPPPPAEDEHVHDSASQIGNHNRQDGEESPPPPPPDSDDEVDDSANPSHGNNESRQPVAEHNAKESEENTLL